MQTTQIRRVAVLGNHLPRRCGIATFTADLARNLLGADAEISVDVIAMNDRPGHEYPAPVKYTIDSNCREAYIEMAARLNEEKYDVLCVQHEFGIYGGDSGCYLLDLLRNVNMPIVPTLHTILQEPTEHQRKTFEELLQLSERVVVMTAKGAQILRESYDFPEARIEVIPHGIHEVDPEMGARLRESMGLADRPLILTFGLLSKDKGIHDMVVAMSSVVNRHPDAAYVILGATHPHVMEREGEKYRDFLARLSQDLGIEKNVFLVNSFVSDKELAGWLAAADIYVTPYLKAEQITSGTLAYAVGAGNAVVSTPYWHAAELLDQDRGMLVPFNDSAGLAEAVSDLLSNPKLREDIGARAFEYGRNMMWPKVGEAYLNAFRVAKSQSMNRLRQISGNTLAWKSLTALPPFSLGHVVALTDDTGMIQHGTYRFQNRTEGYCTDDNARALQLCTLAETRYMRDTVKRLRDIYFTFVMHSFDRTHSRFRNFMSYGREWLDRGSDDCQGRAFLALANSFAARKDHDIVTVSRDLLLRSAVPLAEVRSPRALCSTMIGAAKFLDVEENETMRRILINGGKRLLEMNERFAESDWNWFEDKLTYENALMPRALMIAGSSLGDARMIEIGLSTLGWLCEKQTAANGVFAPIGSNGFYARGGVRAWFDQQPLEATATVSACLDARKISGAAKWRQEAERAFCWFLGDNTEGLSLIRADTGRCFDGLRRGAVNENSGAESTLAYLSARLEIEEVKAVVADRAVNLTEG